MVRLRSVLEGVVTSQRLNKNVLSSICRNCGLPLSSSYTKSKLMDIIGEGLESKSLIHNRRSLVPKDPRSSYNILSIDMGIKNFSYCNFELDAGAPFTNPITIKNWTKLNLLNWANLAPDMELSPSNYSRLSNKLIFELFLQLSAMPDLILIERQRFRSMGSSNVLETVIRSAVLENMVFASLSALQRLDPQKYNYIIQSSSPALMTGYWENFKTSDNERFTKVDSMAKRQRIELVMNWILNRPDKIKTLYENADITAEEKIAKIKNSSRKLFEIVNHFNGGELSKFEMEKRKGDDLADSLLHGLTWLDFERNKIKFSETLSTDASNLLPVLQEIEARHVREIDNLPIE